MTSAGFIDKLFAGFPLKDKYFWLWWGDINSGHINSLMHSFCSHFIDGNTHASDWGMRWSQSACTDSQSSSLSHAGLVQKMHSSNFHDVWQQQYIKRELNLSFLYQWSQKKVLFGSTDSLWKEYTWSLIILKYYEQINTNDNLSFLSMV